MGYKIKIDKPLLKDFLLGNSSSEALAEVRKVFKVVLIKHYPNYQSDPDMYQMMFVYLQDRIVNYDPSKSAYNYIYTISRNCLTNHFYHITKYPTCSLGYDPPISYSDDVASLPDELLKYTDILLGLEDFDIKRIRSYDALNLILFMDHNSNFRKEKLPSFVDSTYSQTLYRLLKLFFYE